MNAISGPTPSSSVAALWTNAPVRPVRRVLANDQRTPAPARDRFERSSASPAPALTYGRDGRTVGGALARPGDAD